MRILVLWAKHFLPEVCVTQTRRECNEQNAPFNWLSFEGDPTARLHLAAETRDIIVTGHDTAYHGNIRGQLPEMLSRQLPAAPRPGDHCLRGTSISSRLAGEPIKIPYGSPMVVEAAAG